MPKKKSEQQKITQAVGMGLLIGVIVWLIALCFAADFVSKSTTSTVYQLRLGPFWLSTLSRRAIEGGYAASISLHSGLAWFVACFGIGNGIVAIYKSKSQRQTSSTQKEE